MNEGDEEPGPMPSGVDGRGVLITLVCAVLGLGIAFLLALQLQQWVDNARGKLTSWKTAIERPAESSLPTRAIPPRDPSKANAVARGNPAVAFGSDNYPPDALRNGEQGRTVTSLTLDASGKPTRCVIVASSGSASLDQATCRIALRKPRYEPARDADGNAISSTVRLPVRWMIPENPPTGMHETVGRLP